jgi:hypothetical protein
MFLSRELNVISGKKSLSRKDLNAAVDAVGLPYGFQYSKRFLLFGIQWVHQVEKVSPTAFSVPSESTDGKSYNVTLDPLFCECPAFYRFKVTPYPFCKHIVAAMVKEQDVTDAFFDWLIEKDNSDVAALDEYIQARFQAGTASMSILEPLSELPITPSFSVEESTAVVEVPTPNPSEEGTARSHFRPLWEVAYQKCCDVVGGKAQVDCIINDLVSWGKLKQDNPSQYDRNEWLLIYHFCQKEASMMRDPKSLNNWSYNSAVFLERCREAIAGRRRRVTHPYPSKEGTHRTLVKEK